MIQFSTPLVQQNSLANQSASSGLPQGIISAIKTAANQTGVDFTYLLKKASQESSLNPNAKASTSSATGLYQFTQQTWLKMVKSYGSQYGLGDYADHISTDSNGVAHVKDPTWRQATLNLRKDPVASAEMAGELDKENQASLQDNVGGKIGATELYLAHFLGAGGASTFLNEMQSNPKEAAADVLPEAAEANPSVFYAKDGTPRSLQQIYHHFASKFDGNAMTMVASASPPKASASSNITVASAASYTYSSPFSGMSSGVNASSAANISNATSGLKSEGSSLFATMILAQMNQDSAAELSNISGQNNNKKNAYDSVNGDIIG